MKVIKADKEFVTEAVSLMCEGKGIRLRQAVPGEHRRGTGEAEGAIRWVQDQAQVTLPQQFGDVNGEKKLDSSSIVLCPTFLEVDRWKTETHVPARYSAAF